MGRYGRRPDSEGRAGAGQRKRIKEISHGREHGESVRRASIADRKGRLDELADQLSITWDHQKREKLLEMFANMAASCPPEVFTPSEMSRIVPYSYLDSQKDLGEVVNYPNAGSRSDFLPLHHLVKLMNKPVPQSNADDSFIYLLDSTVKETIREADLRNLRALEYFLGNFASRLRPGKILSVEVDKKRIVVPYDERGYLHGNEGMMRSIVERGDVPLAERYGVKRIRDGDNKVHATLQVITEQRILQSNEGPKPVLIAY